MVAGGGDWEFHVPIKLGDVITCTTHVADLYEREGKAGKLLFIVTETGITNQRGELAAKGRATLINY
jgi:hydroxyacyl-ACP dehydratase HTD2-like protein with hotdog domain